MTFRTDIGPELSRLEAARDQTANQLRILVRLIEAQAEARTIQLRSLDGQLRRDAPSWTAADEREFQNQLTQLATFHEDSIRSLAGALQRQDARIAALREVVAIAA